MSDTVDRWAPRRRTLRRRAMAGAALVLLGGCVQSGVSGCDCDALVARVSAVPWLGPDVGAEVIEHRTMDFVGEKRIDLLLVPDDAAEVDLDARLAELAADFEDSGLGVSYEPAEGVLAVGPPGFDGTRESGDPGLSIAAVDEPPPGVDEYPVAAGVPHLSVYAFGGGDDRDPDEDLRPFLEAVDASGPTGGGGD